MDQSVTSSVSLSKSQKKRAQKRVVIFEILNAASFIILAGNLILLYALRLGASNLQIGLISSFQHVALFFMLLGRMAAVRFGILRTMIVFWFGRYIVMLPVLATPFMVQAGYGRAALLVLVLGVLGFNVSRGVGMVGFNPLLGLVSDPETRGEFLAKLQIAFYGASIGSGLLIALFLGSETPLMRYAVLMAIGFVFGLVGSYIIGGFPDPTVQLPKQQEKLFSIFKNAFKQSAFRYFALHYMLLSFLLGMALPFIIVYARQVYAQGDNVVIFYTVIGGLGAVSMGFLNRLVMDRLGAKPLYVLFAILFGASIISLIVMPQFVPPDTMAAAQGGRMLTAHTGISLIFLFFCAVFFLFNLGLAGIMNTAHNFFFALVKPSEHLNFGIIYYLSQGLGTAAGAFFGGAVIQGLENTALFAVDRTFQIYFGLLVVLLMGALSASVRLKKVGKYSVRNAFSIIFNPRDFRAVVLLKRLEKAKNVKEEVKSIEALGVSHSDVPIDDLLEKLNSPRYYVRTQALSALEKISAEKLSLTKQRDHKTGRSKNARILGEEDNLEHGTTGTDSFFEDKSSRRKVVAALIREVKNHTFTTAYLAAQILGAKKMNEGVSVLLASLNSRDYLLKAKSLVALALIAKHQDEQSQKAQLTEGIKRARLARQAEVSIPYEGESESLLKRLIKSSRKKISWKQKTSKHSRFELLFRPRLPKPVHSVTGTKQAETAKIIEDVLTKTGNPMVIIHGASALEIMKSKSSVPLLVNLLKRHKPSPFVRDEVVLSVSGILDIHDWFYPYYMQFIKKPKIGLSDLADAFDSGLTYLERKELASFRSALDNMIGKRSEFSKEVDSVLGRCVQKKRLDKEIGTFMQQSAADTELIKFERFLFLLAGIALFYTLYPVQTVSASAKPNTAGADRNRKNPPA